MELGQDSEEAFLEAAIEHIRSVYPESESDTCKDLLELAEQFLQYLLLLSNDNDSDLFAAVSRCDGGK